MEDEEIKWDCLKKEAGETRDKVRRERTPDDWCMNGPPDAKDLLRREIPPKSAYLTMLGE